MRLTAPVSRISSCAFVTCIITAILRKSILRAIHPSHILQFSTKGVFPFNKSFISIGWPFHPKENVYHQETNIFVKWVSSQSEGMKVTCIGKIPATLLKQGGKKAKKAFIALCHNHTPSKKKKKERKQQTAPKLQNHKPNQQPKQILQVIRIASIPPLTKLLASEQAGAQVIFNCRIMIEKRLQHQLDLFYNFIDFKKQKKHSTESGMRGFYKYVEG